MAHHRQIALPVVRPHSLSSAQSRAADEPQAVSNIHARDDAGLTFCDGMRGGSASLAYPAYLDAKSAFGRVRGCDVGMSAPIGFEADAMGYLNLPAALTK
jgi:hypothetical protein